MWLIMLSERTNQPTFDRFAESSFMRAVAQLPLPITATLEDCLSLDFESSISTL
jgi:hypothetical protein